MDMQQITSEIESVAQDLNFPAHKDQVVEKAKNQGASEETIQSLKKLPSQSFGSVGELLQKLPLKDLEGALEKFLQ